MKDTYVNMVFFTYPLLSAMDAYEFRHSKSLLVMTHKEKGSLLRKTASEVCTCCNHMTANLTIMC